MLDQKSLRIVKATAPLVATYAEVITRRFYELLFQKHPEVRGFFNAAHQHSGGQQKALAGAIVAYAAHIDNLAALGPAVDLIAHKHCSLGVQPEHFPIVGRELLAAIKDALGDAATSEVLSAWEAAYSLLAQICIEREANIYREQAAAPGGWTGFRPFVVARKVRECDIVTSFHLEPADGGAVRSFKPGQYLTIKIDHPVTPTSPRNYSLSDIPGTGHYRISVKREPALSEGSPAGLISNYLHDRVQVGDLLQAGPPCGEFTLDPTRDEARPIVLLSAGIGITPVFTMLKSLTTEECDTPVRFLHAARNSGVHALAEEVRLLAAGRANIRTHVRYSDPLPDDLQGGRCDSVGMVDAALLDALAPETDAAFYFCGPRPFMAAMYSLLRSRGVADPDLHFEFFGPRQELLRSQGAATDTLRSTSLHAPRAVLKA